MKTWTWAVLGMLLAVGTAWGQPSDDKAERRIRLKARLELAEMDHEVRRDLLKESMTLLHRAERNNQVNRDRPIEQQKHDEAELDALRGFLERERKQLEDQSVELAGMRRELTDAGTQAQRPTPAALESGDQAMVDSMKRAQSKQGVPRRTPEDDSQLEELGDRVEVAQLNQNLLNTRLNLLGNSLNQKMHALANLEVQATETQNKGDETFQKELEAARKRYEEVRKSYIDLKRTYEREQGKLNELRQRPRPQGQGFQ
jgi:hypothetical protein